MKLLKLVLLSCAFQTAAFAQIDSLLGFHNFDSCKFENVCQMLVLDTSNGNIWEVGIPAKPFFVEAYSPDNAILTGIDLPYEPNNHSAFELHLPNYAFTNMVLAFKHKYQTDTLTDGAYIEVSYDKGFSWGNLAVDTNHAIYNSENLYSIQDTLKGGVYGFSGSSDGWVHTRIQWVWYMLTKTFPIDSVYFRFNFISDSIQTNKDGWMIDDIMISFVDVPGSISESSENDLLKLYPNPNDGTFNFTLPDVMRVSIADALGKHVYEKLLPPGTHSVNFKHLPNGIYYLRAENNKGNHVLRVVVQR